MDDPWVSVDFAPGPQPTITGEDNQVEPRPAGFIVWSSAAGKVFAIATLDESIARDDHDPILWEGDQA